ncbi:MAG TPA: thioredoxin [Pyrodictium delaneyi]|uniref:Thioredoxin n=1 Tax=Pyrodictium delaneyi TaxID=1273541 RepID=A0A832ZT37_9CREN|nr:thioredoxin [Pyrodictium delaneyi]
MGDEQMKVIDEMAEQIKKLVDRKIGQIEQELGDPLYYAGKDFDEVIEKYPVAVVEFAAPWCNPCKAYTPVFRRVARKLMKEYSGRIIFMYMDTDQLPEIADRYNIENIPTTIIFVNGHVADVIMGATQESRLEEKVRNILKEVTK